MTGEDAKTRMVKLTARLYRGEPVTSAYIRQVFGVSLETAKRDMRDLRALLPVSRGVIKRRGCAVTHELRLEIAA